MTTCVESAPCGRVSPRLKFAAALLLSVALSAGHAAQAAPGDDAKEILKKMTDYVAAQQTISAAVDTDVEVITTDLENIQFSSSGQVLMNRPDKLRVSRIGGYTDVDMVFDGRTFSILGKHLNSYAQIDAPGTIDEVVDRLRAESGGAVPGADLLLARAYEEMTADVTEAKHIGRGVVGGVECDHLAFRTPEVDWQLWVEVGPNPIPRKYVITSKTVAQAPQYTLHIKEWRTDAPADATAFEFRPPEGATRVAADSLQHLDEVPPGIVVGGRR